MNILTIVVIAILILFAFLGYKEGLIKTIFSIFSIIVALVLTIIISPQVSKALQANDKIVNTFSEKVKEVMDLDELSQTSKGNNGKIDELPVPDSFKDVLKSNNNTQTQVALGVTNFADYLSHSIACMIINALSFVIVFIIIIIGLKILCTVLDIISTLPVLHQINKLTGLLAGLIRGLIIIWLLCTVLILFSSTSLGRTCFEMINDSVFLSVLYNNNLLIKYVVNITSTIV